MKPNAWHLVIGLSLWFGWFCATYGGLAVACAMVPPPPAQGAWTWLNATVLLLAAVVAAGFGLAAWASARAPTVGERQRFLVVAGTALYAAATLSTAVVALPAVLLAPCL
jgi:hypothetical protein